jgi:hypothetical protein
MFKKLLIVIPKIIFLIFCYAMAIVIGCISAYFTFSFYTDGNTGFDFFALGFMAVSLELIKFVFATVYPFVKYRDIKIEKTILLIMKITFLISILSSIYYLLLGKEVSLSPASRTVEMLYINIPVLNVIPLAFSQFISTISISVLIEFLIIYLPTIAPILFVSKDYNRKTYATSNMDKVREIMKVIPERLINNLHKKIVGNIESESITVNEITSNKLNLKLLKNDISNMQTDRNESKELSNSSDVENDVFKNSVHDRELEELLDVIFKNKEGFICPSVSFLVNNTNLSRNKINNYKKYLDGIGVLYTTGTSTTLQVDTKEEALKAIKNGSVIYDM